MISSRVSLLLFSLGLWSSALSGCFFYSGASTVTLQTQASGSGFLTATERSGQWDADGPPPRVGEVTDRQIYRKLEKGAVYSIVGSSKDYQLSDPYPRWQRHIVAIREAGTSTDNGNTVHYYEVEFALVENN